MIRVVVVYVLVHTFYDTGHAIGFAHGQVLRLLERRDSNVSALAGMYRWSEGAFVAAQVRRVVSVVVINATELHGRFHEFEPEYKQKCFNRASC